MKAYKVNKFQVCQITGSTIIETTFDLEGKLEVSKLEFVSARVAMEFIRKDSEHWFLTALFRFVAHKKNLYMNDISEPVNFSRDVETANTLIKQLGRVNIFEAVIRFKKHEVLFKSILPGESNPSYLSSCENLKQLIYFADHFINLKLNIN